MAQLTNKGAQQVSTVLDRIATLFQGEAEKLGVPEKIALDFAYRCDLLSDHVENAGNPKTALDALDPVKEEGFNPDDIGREVGGPLEQVDSDEPWMSGEFTQQENRELRDAVEGDKLGEVIYEAPRVPNPGKQAALEMTAALGALSDRDVKTYHRDIKSLESDLAETQTELHKLAGVLMGQEKKLSKELKTVVTELKDKLPETLKGQGDDLHKAGKILLSYQKVAGSKPPTVGVVQSGVLEEAEDRFGAEVRQALEEIFEMVVAENTATKKAIAKFTFEVEGTMDKTKRYGSVKEAGIMDFLKAVGSFFGKLFQPLKKLYAMSSRIIKSNVSDMEKSLSDYMKAQKSGKAASEDHGFDLTA